MMFEDKYLGYGLIIFENLSCVNDFITFQYLYTLQIILILGVHTNLLVSEYWLLLYANMISKKSSHIILIVTAVFSSLKFCENISWQLFSSQVPGL